jgi:hypothetical protein
MILMVEFAVGYMLKVLKNEKRITEYKNEFNAIKHCDYKTFLSLIDSEIPPMVIYNNGRIRAEENNPKYDFDFEGLLKSGPSLRIFFKKCFLVYGNIEDPDIPDSIYHKVVVFEIALRMHANNNNLLDKTKQEDLINVISILSKFKNLTQEEEDKLQKARVFTNMVKHFKNQYPSWEIGISYFLDGFSVLEKHKILVG